MNRNMYTHICKTRRLSIRVQGLGSGWDVGLSCAHGKNWTAPSGLVVGTWRKVDKTCDAASARALQTAGMVTRSAIVNDSPSCKGSYANNLNAF